MPIESNILLGKVLDNKDEEGLGRVQVELRGFAEAWTTPWLRVLQPSAGAEFGHYFLPDVDSEVVILRGFGDHPDGLIVLGCLYGLDNAPSATAIDADGNNAIKQLRTKAGHEITLSEVSGEEKISITTSDTKLSVVMDMANGEVIITGDKAVKIVSTEAVNVTGKTVVITGSTSVTIEKSETVKIDGAKTVDINGSSKISLTGGEVAISGSAIKLG
ncbi:MAG: hypothetical protein H6739_34950 [Alphaproteobacteria bacterium]|nr:hypothetical protein [Alphaproteobacteria bacterium]